MLSQNEACRLPLLLHKLYLQQFVVFTGVATIKAIEARSCACLAWLKKKKKNQLAKQSRLSNCKPAKLSDASDRFPKFSIGAWIKMNFPL